MNFGYAGAGEWARKVDDFSDDDAHALKTYDIKPEEEVELEADQHYEIDDLLPPEDFYEDLDVLVLANRVSNHETQFYHAMNHMDEDSLVITEKALGPRHVTHQRVAVNGELDEGPDFIPTLHYWKKPAAQKTEEVMEEYDLEGINKIEVVAQEERMERGWILTPYEGGSVVDFGSHAPELPIINLDGRFTAEPLNYAVGWDTGSGIENEVLARYNEAFEASWNIEGDLFNEAATLNALVGKNFDEDRKEFLIEGVDPEIGGWEIHGHYGTREEPPALEFSTNEMYQEWDLSDRTAAKKAIVDDFMEIARGEKEPELTPEKHADMMRGLELANREIGLYRDEELKVEEWTGEPKLKYDLLESERKSPSMGNF